MVAPAESPHPFRRRRVSPPPPPRVLPPDPLDWWVTDLPCPPAVKAKLERPVDLVYVRELLALTRARLQEATGLDARELHELRAAVRAAGLTPPDDWYAPSAYRRSTGFDDSLF